MAFLLKLPWQTFLIFAVCGIETGMQSIHLETLSKVRSVVKRVLKKRSRKGFEPLALDGFAPSTLPAPSLDSLSHEELRELNSILRWNCFTVDSNGRRFGNRAKPGKRESPQSIPDARIETLHEIIGLKAKRVLEVGCFEGVHTTGLSMLGAQVTAVDSRLENIVKTMVRCGFYGVSPKVFLANVDSYPLDSRIQSYDVAFHCGVLYHLVDPVRHLFELAARIEEGILLDTHYCLDNEAVHAYTYQGQDYSYKRFGEHGKDNVFAGMYDHAKWLPLESLKSLLVKLGFKKIELCRTREERNGPRVLIIARR